MMNVNFREKGISFFFFHLCFFFFFLVPSLYSFCLYSLTCPKISREKSTKVQHRFFSHVDLEVSLLDFVV